MLVYRPCLSLTCLVLLPLLSAVQTLSKRQGVHTETVAVRKRSDAGDSGEAYVVNAFGKDYTIGLQNAQRKRLADVPVYVTTRGKTHREDLPEDEDDVYIVSEDGKHLAVTKKRSADGNIAYVDGLLSGEDGGIFIESSPWQEKRGEVPHAVTRGRDVAFKQDFDYVKRDVEREQEKRATRTYIDATIDLLLIIDNGIYRQELRKYRNNRRKALKAIRKYYKMVVSMVDLRYADIKNRNLKIRVKLAGIYISMDRRAASWVEYNLKRSPSNPSEMAIDPNVALANLRKWLVKMKSELPAHDHAMGFTWYPMISDTTGHPVAGMAYIGTICQTKEAWSSSVVEEFGGFSSVGTATHELGHSLGSGHDGVGNIGRQCPGSNNNIMAPGNSGGKNELKNYFSFSWCSLKQFQDLLSSSKADCLFDTQVAGGSHNVVPKVVSSPDKQCKQMFGPKSGFCKMKVLRQELCLRLWCLMPDDHDRCESQGQLAASFGTPCGDQKWCKNGECVFDARAPKDTRCRFGDKNPTYCRNLGAGKEQACKRPDIRKLCCAACAE